MFRVPLCDEQLVFLATFEFTMIDGVMIEKAAALVATSSYAAIFILFYFECEYASQSLQ